MAIEQRPYKVDDAALAEDPMSEVLADETITFTVNGRRYEIDLSAGNASRFYADLFPWMTAARLVGRTGGHRSAASRTSARRIRQWAREHDIEVKDNGRISGELAARYAREAAVAA
ncbi:MAG: hypothetical protein JWM19_988 [Actinomycetia bacterium]|nr:hypothetical protein [Actinomycetes bacterium]